MSEELASTKKAADKVSAELEGTKGKLDKAATKGKELGDEFKELKKQMSEELASKKKAADRIDLELKDVYKQLAISKTQAGNFAAELKGSNVFVRMAATRERELVGKVNELEGQLSQSQEARSRQSQHLECLKGEHAAKVQEYESTIKTANEEFEHTRKLMSLKTAMNKADVDKVSAQLVITKEQLVKANSKCREMDSEAEERQRQLLQNQAELARMHNFCSHLQEIRAAKPATGEFCDRLARVEQLLRTVKAYKALVHGQ